jgi:glycosyltransferase involved in cell wall biosynthesis
VVIPAYNAEMTIGAAISGALQQTADDLEVIVVDDGSTDRTRMIAAAFGERIRLIEQENEGPSAARNTGIAAATAPLVTLCDADDLLLDAHVEALLSVHRDHGGIVTANAFWLFAGGIDPRQTRHRGRFPAPAAQRQAILETNFVSTMSLFPRALWEELGGFDVTLRHAEDWDFWLRAIHVAGIRVSHQPRPLALYRWSDQGLSSDTRAMDLGVRRVLEKVADSVSLTATERRYVELRLRSPSPATLARRGDDELLAGRYTQAADTYREASRLAPTDRVLATKTRVMRLAPRLAGPALRRRGQRRRERGHASPPQT